MTAGAVCVAVAAVVVVRDPVPGHRVGVLGQHGTDRVHRRHRAGRPGCTDGRAVEVGDIVTFPSPQDGTSTIKRVVAVAGQRVAIRDAELVVDGRTVDEPYVDHASIDGVYFGP